MTPAGDSVLAVARRVETMLTAIAYAEDRSDVLDLQRRAAEMISELPRAHREKFHNAAGHLARGGYGRPNSRLAD